jgi:hypothetical protein
MIEEPHHHIVVPGSVRQSRFSFPAFNDEAVFSQARITRLPRRCAPRSIAFPKEMDSVPSSLSHA